MTTFVSGVQKLVVFAPESTYGVLPAANTGVSKRRVKFELDLKRDTYSSAEINSTAQTSDMRSGQNKFEGTLSGELSPKSYAVEFASLLRGTWATGTAYTATVISAQSAGTFTTTGSWITQGFKVGDLVKTTGFTNAANNSTWTIVALTATVMTVDAGSLGNSIVTEVAGASVTVQLSGKKLIIPLDAASRTDASFSAEQYYSTLGISERYSGLKISSAKIDAKPAAITTVEFGMMGQSVVTSTSQYFTSPTAAATTGVVAGAAGALYLDGTKIATVTSLNAEITGNLETGAVLGTRNVANVFLGRVTAKGEFSAYFTDSILYTKFVNEEALTLTFRQDGNSGESFVITFPKIKLTSTTKDDKEVGGIIQTVGFTALLNDGTNTSLDQSTVVLVDSTL